jgi:hypothetical protein
MAAVRSALESDKGEGNWTAYQGALDRRILRVDLFRKDADEAAVKNAAVPSAVDRAKRASGKD